MSALPVGYCGCGQRFRFVFNSLTCCWCIWHGDGEAYREFSAKEIAASLQDEIFQEVDSGKYPTPWRPVNDWIDEIHQYEGVAR